VFLAIFQLFDCRSVSLNEACERDCRSFSNESVTSVRVCETLSVRRAEGHSASIIRNTIVVSIVVPPFSLQTPPHENPLRHRSAPLRCFASRPLASGKTYKPTGETPDHPRHVRRFLRSKHFTQRARFLAVPRRGRGIAALLVTSTARWCGRSIKPPRMYGCGNRSFSDIRHFLRGDQSASPEVPCRAPYDRFPAIQVPRPAKASRGTSESYRHRR